MPISRETQPAEGATPSEGASSARARTPAFAVTDRRSRRAAVRLSELQRQAASQPGCLQISSSREFHCIYLYSVRISDCRAGCLLS